jgi:gamma-glutamyl:cysteine ligase YbdK (ATP-grasp superfamily)
MLMIALAGLISCNSQQKLPDAGTVVQLPSGKSVRVYPVERVSFVNDMLPASLLLRYETSLEPVDSKALRDEVREVWQILQPKADSSGDSYAMIKANKSIRGLITRTESFTYGFNRIKKGVWKMREPPK